MRQWPILALALILPTPLAAQPACRPAVEAAERAAAIPPHLLGAIARVESGRRDAFSGAVNPWPWTINVEGEGYFYDSKAEAIAAVRAFQAKGIRSIDVGCMQVNLMHHPDAFPNLDLAFDPQFNAGYAARFLRELYGQAGDWGKAAALYHSATPEIGDEYRQKVLAVWPEEVRVGASASPLAKAWASTLAAPPPGITRVIRMQPAAAGPAPHVIMLPLVNGASPPGRSLAAYRAAPVALAFRPMQR
jgi:Transglycosylase SLT domain